MSIRERRAVKVKGGDLRMQILPGLDCSDGLYITMDKWSRSNSKFGRLHDYQKGVLNDNGLHTQRSVYTNF